MPLEQTITIINNSGKIISTGKHLVNIFKDAKAAYQEKKATIKAERAGLSRAATFDVRREPTLYDEPEEYDHHYHAPYHGHQQHRGAPYVEYEEPRYIEDRRRSVDGRRRSHDEVSRASSTTSRSTRRPPRRSQTARPPLTATNLRTHSEISSTAPSRAPQPRAPAGYRSPYAETAPRDMALSRPTLAHVQPQSYLGSVVSPSQYQGGDDYQSTVISSPRQSMHVARPRSDPSLRKRKSIDMNLAYGNIPPDLASRVDLEPKIKSGDNPEAEARTLMSRIEGLLTEAHCLHFTASAIIAHLQGNPDAAAAVALTLAELSAVLGKLSPAFLGVIKGGSPAVFALLASPQFLIGTGVVVGVTVIMFGGWKIVKRMQQAAALKKEEEAGKMAFDASGPDAGPGPMPAGAQGFAAGARFGGGRSAGMGSFDEALVLEEELSTIESWRRGIEPYAEDGSVIESVEGELITPEALRSQRDDGRSIRTTKTHKSHKSHRSSKSHRTRRASDAEIPERKSSKAFDAKESKDKSRDRDRDDRSESGSHRSSRSSRSKRAERTEVKAIEDGRRQESDSLEMVLRPKKNNMLKSLFKKKKDKEDQKERSEVSVKA